MAYASAVTGYMEMMANLSVTYRTADRLNRLTEYYTATSGGGVAGYIQHQNIKNSTSKRSSADTGGTVKWDSILLAIAGCMWGLVGGYRAIAMGIVTGCIYVSMAMAHQSVTWIPWATLHGPKLQLLPQLPLSSLEGITSLGLPRFVWVTLEKSEG